MSKDRKQYGQELLYKKIGQQEMQIKLNNFTHDINSRLNKMWNNLAVNQKSSVIWYVSYWIVSAVISAIPYCSATVFTYFRQIPITLGPSTN